MTILTHNPLRILSSAILASAFVLSCILGCCQNTITDASQIVFPASGVSYERHVQPFFNLTCAYSGCHNSAQQAGSVNLSSYFDTVVSRPGLVVAGKPEQSLLAQIIDINVAGRPPHRQSFQAVITANHIAGIKTWIREGAK